MKLRALFLSGCVALTGCATTDETVHQNVQQSEVTTIASLQKSPLKLDNPVKVVIDGNTQVLNSGTIDSPVIAFDIPADRGPLDISVTSQMVSETFFSPEIVIVDNHGELVEEYDSSTFEYRRPRLAWGDRLVAEFRFTPPVAGKMVTMLIYTTEAELAKATDRIHPARAMAEGMGNSMPEAKDIPTPHVKTGELLVKMQGANSGFFGDGNKESKSMDEADEATQSYYHNAIQKAVEEDNIPKARSLLDEAIELGVEDAQKVYVDAVNAKD